MLPVASGIASALTDDAMKNTKKKLELNSQTIRNLHKQELDRIAGGAYTDSLAASGCQSLCYTCGKPCVYPE